MRVNGWSEILFSIPQKVHKKINPVCPVDPESIVRCMSEIRPYHALLLLKSEKEILEDLPLDYNTGFRKIIEQASPVKNLRCLAADTALTKKFVSWFRYFKVELIF